jgi:pyruvate dehydrogenase E2 component (dihydrolipoamide acetyltransferase)
MAEIVMPRLSDTMEEGTVLRWLKQDGEHIRRGEELVEIETDKAAMVYESDQEGVLQIVAREGDTLAVGATIAHAGNATSPTAVARPADRQATSGGASPATSSAPNTGSPHGERIKASPLARRIAGENGVDLLTLTGSGPGGRIVKADVEAASAMANVEAASAMANVEDASTMARSAAIDVPGPGADAGPTAGTPTAPSSAAGLAERVATAKGESTVVELTRTQQTIARRMAESKATIPDFSLQLEIEMEECVALRTELKRLSPEEAPTYNDMVVKACALALREHPHANGSYRDGRLLLHSRVNVGVAVAADDALVVPTIFDADLKSLGEIARATRTLAERVRAGAITPPELGGGTFTVSNLGMYGVRSFTAIVNPPQAGILSVGSLAPRAVVREREIVARDTMAVTLACDHRILYGADAARFLARIRQLLEEPAALTL